MSSYATRADEPNPDDEPIPENYTLDSIKPPKYWAEPEDGEFLCCYVCIWL